MATGEMPRTIAPLPLLEREAEMAALDATLAAASVGDGRLVVIEGSAGIGKTRLLAEVRVRARAAGFDVLTARGGELEGEFAFGIVRQLFEARLAAASPELRAELLAGAAELSASLFASAPATASTESSDSSFAMLHGLYWLTANIATRAPTLIVVDDLHWADEPSLRWLVYLARRLDGLSALLVVGTRPPEQATLDVLIGELLADAAGVVMRPGGLGRESAVALARERLGDEPATAFAAALETGSGGNPLYLVALLDAVARQGLAPTAENAVRVLASGPRAVSYGVTTRLARLPMEATDLLRAAAILGDGTELALAAALAAIEPGAALAAASSLVRADLLAEENPVEFTHPVIRSAVLEQMSADERTRAHRRAAALLLDRGAVPEQAATYLVRTVPSGDPFVVATLRDAARRLLIRGAPQVAASYLLRVLDEPPEAHLLCDVLHELGDAELRTGVGDACRHLGQAVRTETDPARRAPIVLSYARSLLVLGRAREAVDLLGDTSDTTRAQDRELHWALEAALVLASEYTPALYPIITERLAAQAEEELGDSPAAGALLSVRAFEEGRTGSSRVRAVDFARRALASGISDDVGGIPFVITGAWALMLAGLPDEAAQALGHAIDLARRHGDLPMHAVLHVISAAVRLEQGELAAAEEDLAAFDDAIIDDLPITQPLLVACAADVLLERGALEDAEQAVATPGPPDLQGQHIFLHGSRGRVALASGRAESALDEFLAVGSLAASLGIENPAFLPWRSGAALALGRLGRDAEAHELAEEELALARRWGAPRATGMALHALALVKQRQEREDLLTEATDLLATSPARLAHARALVDLGAALRRANSRSAARQRLREGIEIAHGCGASALVRRANEELAATGAHPRTILLSGSESLTASERRVAQMAADDLSNKEIAQALFVTVKTVEQHLGRVYRKLDIGSRRQLGAALAAPA